MSITNIRRFFLIAIPLAFILVVAASVCHGQELPARPLATQPLAMPWPFPEVIAVNYCDDPHRDPGKLCFNRGAIAFRSAADTAYAMCSGPYAMQSVLKEPIGRLYGVPYRFNVSISCADVDGKTLTMTFREYLSRYVDGLIAILVVLP